MWRVHRLDRINAKKPAKLLGCESRNASDTPIQSGRKACKFKSELSHRIPAAITAGWIGWSRCDSGKAAGEPVGVSNAEFHSHSFNKNCCAENSATYQQMRPKSSHPRPHSTLL